MSTTKEALAAEREYKFTPKISPRWALNLQQVAAVGLFGVLFLTLNWIPLRCTDIWGHVMYGQWIVNHGALPTADPWMPLAQGMRVVDTAWLSQVIFGLVDQYLGPQWLSHLFALLNLAAYIVWARIFFLQTRRLWLSLLCTGLLIFVGWSRFATIRPENFAVVCFAVMFLLLARAQCRRSDGDPSRASESFDLGTWLGIPLVFALWANLHGSFVMGLVVLACYFLGRVATVAWQSRSAGAVLADTATRRWLYLLELAAAATLLNPYGLDLWIHTIQFSTNPNLASILEWQPLVILGAGGRPFAVSIVLLLFIFRLSHRPIRPAEVLLLIVFAFTVVMGVRMLGWYAPVFAFVVAPHLAEIAGRWLPARQSETSPRVEMARTDEEEPRIGADGEAEDDEEFVLPAGQSFRYSLVALLLIWIAVALSPLGQQLIFRKPRPAQSFLARNTPIHLTAYLKTAAEQGKLPGGQAFHPQWWGDWLKREGPPQMQAFVTSNIHLAPPQVWRDYLRIMSLQSGWEGALDRYNVTMIVVDKNKQKAMLGALNRDPLWTKADFLDEQAAIFFRNREASTPAPPPPPTSAAGDQQTT